MKWTLIALGAGLLVVAWFVFGGYFSNSFTVENESKEVIVEKEVEVDSIEKRIKEAQAAAMADIEAEANQMRDEFIAAKLAEVESQLLDEVKAEIDDRQDDADKRSGQY